MTEPKEKNIYTASRASFAVVMQHHSALLIHLFRGGNYSPPLKNIILQLAAGSWTLCDFLSPGDCKRPTQLEVSPGGCIYNQNRGEIECGNLGGEVDFRQSTETQILTFLYKEYHRRLVIPLPSLAGGFLLERLYGFSLVSYRSVCRSV